MPVDKKDHRDKAEDLVLKIILVVTKQFQTLQESSLILDVTIFNFKSKVIFLHDFFTLLYLDV